MNIIPYLPESDPRLLREVGDLIYSCCGGVIWWVAKKKNHPT